MTQLLSPVLSGGLLRVEAHPDIGPMLPLLLFSGAGDIAIARSGHLLA